MWGSSFCSAHQAAVCGEIFVIMWKPCYRFSLHKMQPIWTFPSTLIIYKNISLVGNMLFEQDTGYCIWIIQEYESLTADIVSQDKLHNTFYRVDKVEPSVSM